MTFPGMLLCPLDLRAPDSSPQPSERRMGTRWKEGAGGGREAVHLASGLTFWKGGQARGQKDPGVLWAWGHFLKTKAKNMRESAGWKGHRTWNHGDMPGLVTWNVIHRIYRDLVSGCSFWLLPFNRTLELGLKKRHHLPLPQCPGPGKLTRATECNP